MDRKRDFILYLPTGNLSELDNFTRTLDTNSMSFYHQSSIIFKQITLLNSLLSDDDMYYNYSKYGHKSRIEGFKHRQKELERIGIQPIIDDANQAGEAVKLIHEWLNKQLGESQKIFNIKSKIIGESDEIMNKKGVVACLYHMLQQVTDKIKQHETEALEAKSQLHTFKSLLNPPTNALDDYDFYIPSLDGTTNKPVFNPDIIQRGENFNKKSTHKNKNKNGEDGKNSKSNNVQTQESDLLIQQNEQLVQVFADVSQDIDIVSSVQNRIREISSMFAQFSTTLDSQLDIFENIRDNLQMSIGNIESTGENLKKSLEKEFSLAITLAYLFLIAGIILFLLDVGRWF